MQSACNSEREAGSQSSKISVTRKVGNHADVRKEKQEMNGKSKVVAGLLAIFLGGLGAHRFYLGQPKKALLYIAGLFFFGISVIVGFFEGVRYLLINEAKFVEELRRGSPQSPQLNQGAKVSEIPRLEADKPAYLARVQTEKFDLTLYEKQLRIVRRFHATTLKQIVDTAITNASEGEYAVDLSSISGVKLTPASNDKISFGKFSGRLAFISSLDTTNQIVGTRHQGELEFDFPISRETEVWAFVRAFEAQREKVRASVQEKPMVSSSKSFSDELKEMAELRASGLLTEEEFSKAKKKFLEG